MIYVLEDDASIQKLVVYTLNSQGMEALGFDRPSQFWSALALEKPELVLLDIMLPEEDGLQVLKKLRADPATRRTPVLMLTAKSTEYDKVLGLDQGADDYIAKPFGMMELMARIRTALRHAGGPGGAGDRLSSGTAVCRPGPPHRPGRGAGRGPDAERVSASVPAAGAPGKRVHPGPAAEHHLGL